MYSILLVIKNSQFAATKFVKTFEMIVQYKFDDYSNLLKAQLFVLNFNLLCNAFCF